MSALVDILSALCLAGGGFFCLVGGIGLLRMPDFYTRMHAGSVIETLLVRSWPTGSMALWVMLAGQPGLLLFDVRREPKKWGLSG